MRCIIDSFVVLLGSLSVVSLVLLILIFNFQAPFGVSCLADLENLKLAIWDYLLFQNEGLLIGHEQLNIREERHLLDVQRLVQKLINLIGGILITFLVALYFLNSHWECILKSVGILGVFSILLLLLLALVFGFRTAFVWLHSVFFIKNTWWFNKESSLIQVFPFEYFQQFIVLFCLISLFAFCIIYCITLVVTEQVKWPLMKPLTN